MLSLSPGQYIRVFVLSNGAPIFRLGSGRIIAPGIFVHSNLLCLMCMYLTTKKPLSWQYPNRMHADQVPSMVHVLRGSGAWRQTGTLRSQRAQEGIRISATVLMATYNIVM